LESPNGSIGLIQRKPHEHSIGCHGHLAEWQYDY
jgi:hypothetical protein